MAKSNKTPAAEPAAEPVAAPAEGTVDLAKEEVGTEDNTQVTLTHKGGADLGETEGGKDLLDGLFEEPGFMTEDMEKAMTFDPFTPDPTPVVVDKSGEQKEEEKPPDEIIRAEGDEPLPTGEEAKGAEAAPAAEGEVEKDPATVEPTDAELLRNEVVLLKQTNAELLIKVSEGAAVQPQLTAAQAAAAVAALQKGEEGAVPAPAPAETPSFLLQMPQDLMAQLNSEEPSERSQGFSNLVNGIGQMMHGHMIKVLEEKLTATVALVEQRATAQQTRSVEETAVLEDFYGKFPKLNDDAIRPLVQQVTSQLVQETGANKWSPELRDAIGIRTTQIIKAAAGNPGGNGGGETAPGTTQPVSKPPNQMKGGARPQAASETPTAGEMIEDTLFGPGVGR